MPWRPHAPAAIPGCRWLVAFALTLLSCKSQLGQKSGHIAGNSSAPGALDAAAFHAPQRVQCSFTWGFDTPKPYYAAISFDGSFRLTVAADDAGAPVYDQTVIPSRTVVSDQAVIAYGPSGGSAQLILNPDTNMGEVFVNQTTWVKTQPCTVDFGPSE